MFQIVPFRKYKATNKLRQLIDTIKKKNPDMDTFEALEEGGAPAEHLKTLSDAEAQDNELDLKRRMGDNVTYGQVIQLLHVASHQYIRTSPTATSTLDAR